MLKRPVRKWSLVAAVVLVLVAVATGLILRSTPFGTSTRALCAEFTDTSGLYEGNVVAMLGKKVGQVVAVHETPQSVRVDMEVDQNLVLPAEVGATLVSTSIVTERQVEFTEPYSGGAKYDSSSCIPIAKTRTPLGISQTLDSIDQLSDDLLKDDGANTDAVVQSLKLISQNMQGTETSVSSILRNSASLIDDPARRDGQIRRIVENLATLTEVPVKNSAEVSALLANFVNAIEVIIAFGEEFCGAVEYADIFVPILSRFASDLGPPIFEIGDTAVPLVADAANRPDVVATFAVRMANLIGEYPDAKSIVKVFSRSIPLQSLVDQCGAPTAQNVCSGNAGPNAGALLSASQISGLLGGVR